MISNERFHCVFVGYQVGYQFEQRLQTPSELNQQVFQCLLILFVLLLQCGREFSKENVVVLNGSEEEVKRQREAMVQRRLEAKQAKLAKVGLGASEQRRAAQTGN